VARSEGGCGSGEEGCLMGEFPSREDANKRLGRAFADKMAGVAIDAIRLKGQEPDLLRLQPILARLAKPALEEGVRDAREAVAAGLSGWADVTFFASAGAWGAKAAKEYLGEP
jgi:hypothetical protein